MPILLALGGLLLQLCASMVGRVLLALSLGFVTYTGFDFVVTSLLNQIKNAFAGMPADVVNFLAWCWVDKAIGMMFSAYTAAIAIKTAGNGTLTKLVRK